MASFRFQTSFCFFLFTLISSSSTSMAVSYNDHCSSIVPESNPTIPINKHSIPYLSTPYFNGGDMLLHRKKLRNQTYYFVGKFLKLLISPDYYQTNATSIFKVHGFLKINLPFTCNHHRDDMIMFSMNGFWSENSRKLCMVGSASFESINLDAVLKLKYATYNNPNVYSSVATGILESVSSSNDDPSFFDTISMFSFPFLPNYEYSLIHDHDEDFHDLSLKNEALSLSLSRERFCSAFGAGPTVVELEYAAQCSREPRRCSPLPRSTPRILFLNPIQCSEGKFRYTAKFHNMSKDFHDFSPESVLVGEASWDDERQHLYGFACRVSNPWTTHSRNAVEDCSMRLKLWYPSVMTVRNEAKISGQLWTTRAVEESGFFRKISLSSAYENGVVSFREGRYEYTELDRARASCPLKKAVKKKGEEYLNVDSYDMRFDVSIKSSKGELLSWGYASPVAVGNDTVDVTLAEAPESSDIERVGVSEPRNTANCSDSNISYRIMLNLFPDVTVNASNWFPRLNESVALHHNAEIMAEGFCNGETGELCMVGCRN